MSASERLKRIVKHCGLKNSEFAESVGLSSGGLSDILSGRNKGISNPVVKAIQYRYNVNPTWLLTGEGEMSLSGTPQKKEEPYLYNAEDGVFIQGDKVITGRAKAKAALEAAQARENKSQSVGDSVSLDGLDEEQRKIILSMIKQFRKGK